MTPSLLSDGLANASAPVLFYPVAGLVTTPEEVQTAVIIEAQGTFVDPAGQATGGAGSGSFTPKARQARAHGSAGF